MISKLTLLSNLLLASVALAVPSSRLGNHLARRDKIRQSQPLSRVASSARNLPVEGSPGWAGVVLADSNQTFSLVVGTFTVPTITGKDGSASIWVGIDGNPACEHVILQTGIDFTIALNQTYYQAWYEWYPAQSQLFYDINIRPGDVITATVAADNTTFGMVVIENRTTNQTVYKELRGNASTALCEASAEWIVEDYVETGVRVSLANFSSVTFSDAYAMGPDGKKHTLSDPQADSYIVDIVNNNTVLTYVAIHGDDVTIQYIDGFF